MSNEDPQAQPPVPPVPPVPRYGEYAPTGTPEAPAIPPAPPVQSAPDTVAPTYGYAQPAAGYGYGVPAAAPARRRRTWDLVLTIILLVAGVFGAGIGLVYAAILTSPELLSEALTTQGYSWNGSVGNASAIIAISHLVLYFASLGVSIALMVKGRIAFWVPLTAGVIAAIIFWVTIVGVFLSDPNFINSVPTA